MLQTRYVIWATLPSPTQLDPGIKITVRVCICVLYHLINIILPPLQVWKLGSPSTRRRYCLPTRSLLSDLAFDLNWKPHDKHQP